MKTFFQIVGITLALALPAVAQIEYAFKNAIPAPLKPQGGEYFGYSVAVDGNYVVVGIPEENDSTGVVKVFDAATGAQTHVLPHPRPNDGDVFGNSVSISGTIVAVGARRDDGGETGRVFVFDLARANPTAPWLTLNNPSPADDDDFGASVSISGTRLVVGTPGDNTGQENSGLVYVYNLAGATPTVPVNTLPNPTPAFLAYFGTSVAISGTRVVVGTRADRCHIYDLAGATPTVPTATIGGPTSFGWSVAISGTRAVIGASQASTFALYSGAVYVYNIGGAITPLETTLGSANASSYSFFGSSVAISGTRVVVGATGAYEGPVRPGRAYVYNLGITNPNLFGLTIQNPTPEENDNFGAAVAISGSRVVVGAPEDNTDAVDLGSAYLYDIAGANPAIPTSTLHSPGLARWMEFGAAAAISGGRAAIGAPGDDSTTGYNAGRVHIYNLASATFSEPLLTLTNPGTGYNGEFGRAIAMSGSRVVIGAPGQLVAGVPGGIVHIFDLDGATPIVPAFSLPNPTPLSGENFGGSVAIDGSIVVVGAPTEYLDNGAPGGAYLYNLAAANPATPTTVLTRPNPVSGDYFGQSVAISGFVVVVGAPYFDDAGKTNTGIVYVYDTRTPGSPTLTIRNPLPGDMDNFGYAVAVSGMRVAVGAPGDSTGLSGSGSVYVYDLASANAIVPVLTINNAEQDSFGLGTTLSMSATRLIAGAPPTRGSAHVYDLASATPTLPLAVLVNPTSVNNEQFGTAVAIEGTTALVGAPFAGTSQAITGRAYIYGTGVGGSGSGGADDDHDGLPDGWEQLYFGTTSGHSALDDADGDGLCELLEYAFDRHPLWPEIVPAPQTAIEGGYLTVTIAKRPGVTYLVQSSATPENAGYSATTTTVLADSPTFLKVRDNVLVGTLGSRFLRVKVTSSP